MLGSDFELHVASPALLPAAHAAIQVTANTVNYWELVGSYIICRCTLLRRAYHGAYRHGISKPTSDQLEGRPQHRAQDSALDLSIRKTQSISRRVRHSHARSSIPGRSYDNPVSTPNMEGELCDVGVPQASPLTSPPTMRAKGFCRDAQPRASPFATCNICSDTRRGRFGKQRLLGSTGSSSRYRQRPLLQVQA